MDKRWKIILAFILGMVFGELSSDFTDWIYFTYYRDVTPETAPLIWYWMTAGWYMLLFVFAFLIAKTHVIRPDDFIYILMFMTAVGGLLSFRALSSELPTGYLMFAVGVPVMVSLGLLLGLRRHVYESAR